MSQLELRKKPDTQSLTVSFVKCLFVGHLSQDLTRAYRCIGFTTKKSNSNRKKDAGHSEIDREKPRQQHAHSPARGLCELHIGWGLLEPLKTTAIWGLL